MILQNIIGIANLLIVAATGYVVWLYTQAAQRSNEIQEQPMLNFYFKEVPNTPSTRLGNISVKNIGKGPAYSISFEPIELKGYRYRFYLDSPLLESGQEASPRAAIRTPEGATEAFERTLMWFLHRLVPQTLTHEALEYAKNNPAIFLARYQGANGKRYYSVFALYCNLPPVGDIIMQFLAHGSGTYSLEDAKAVWLQAKKISSPFSDA